MLRKYTTSLLLFILLLLPVQMSEASPLEGELEEQIDELEETIDEVQDIEMSVNQSNDRILKAIKERAFQAIYDRSQIVQNISQSKKELKQAKETSRAIKDEMNRIRTDQSIEITEDQLARLIKQSSTTIKIIKNSEYKIGQSSYELIGLIQEVKNNNLLGAKYQLDALIHSSHNRVASLQSLNSQLEAVLTDLQQIQ